MRREYEVALVLRSDPNEEVINQAVALAQAWIEANQNGQVMKIDRWGRRKLAYEINKQREGYYVFMTAEIEPASLLELERNLKLSPAVLRYLLVRPD